MAEYKWFVRLRTKRPVCKPDALGLQIGCLNSLG